MTNETFKDIGKPEADLREVADNLRANVDAAVGGRDYRFFDGVMVMAENPKVRNNRLALLAAVQALFTGIADFRQIAAG